METTRLWLEESNKTDNLIVFVQQNSSKIYRKKRCRTLRCLHGVAKHCSQALNNKGSQWQAICMAAGFGPLSHLWEKSKMFVGEFLRLHQSQCWPPNSPDFNPMDYYVQGAVEKDTNCRASTAKAQLIDRIKVVFETLPRETVISACSSFRGRIEAVIDANGGYFE